MNGLDCKYTKLYYGTERHMLPKIGIGEVCGSFPLMLLNLVVSESLVLVYDESLIPSASNDCS